VSAVQAAATVSGMLCTFINKAIVLCNIFSFTVNVYMKEETSVRIN